MRLEQYIISLRPRRRGFHLISDEIAGRLPALSGFRVGQLYLLLLHTSASLCLNENTDPDVALDLESVFSGLVPDGGYRHSLEGADDMSAHAKNAILGPSLTLPLRDGALLLGTWQGIYLCEHRENAGPRRLAATLIGE